MTIPGIWTEGDEGWRLSRPDGFPDEATLHRLIEQNPDMLPLAGAPRLVILGSEVGLGPGSADLLGVEASGRPVIIEIKLARNDESRRAVVAQILAYAAYLHGMTQAQLEDRLRESLEDNGHATILDAVTASDKEGTFDQDEFTATLDDHLKEGLFRLVFVLDDVPQELMMLVAYLDNVAEKLIIDLVAVGAFDVNGTPVMIPQRVVPERHKAVAEQTRRTERGRSQPARYPGADKFEELFEDAPEENRDTIESVLNWARDLERRSLAKLLTSIGRSNKTLRPVVPGDGASLVTIWLDGKGVLFTCPQSVLERLAPDLIDKVPALSPNEDWTIPFSHITEDVLSVLTEAYEQAAKYPNDEGS